MATIESTPHKSEGANRQYLSSAKGATKAPKCSSAVARADHVRVLGEIPDRILQHISDSDICGTFTPEDGGPTLIVVGERASTERLRGLAAKHHLEPEALMMFARRH